MYRYRLGWLVLIVLLPTVGRAQSAGETAAVAPVLAEAKDAVAAEAWDRALDLLDRVVQEAPGHMEALYYRGICHREQAKYRTLVGYVLGHHWGQSAQDFEAVIAQNSLYRDVWYQYALLRRYAERFPEAVALGQRQVRLRPDLAEAHLGLFSLYRYLVAYEKPEEALAILRADTSVYGPYFIGEVERLAGDLDAAAAAFEAVLQAVTSLPRQPVLLSLARIAYERGETAAGQRYVDQALAGIRTPLEAWLVFEDFKYVLDEEEWATYQRLQAPEAYVAFFRALWAKRDPLPSREVNERLAEHYRRLVKAERDYPFFGFRTWFNNPDRIHELAFPKTYGLVERLNDRGIIYIRHGEPAEVVRTLNATSIPNESWRYYDPDLIFHFVVGTDAAPGNWRLTPVLEDPSLLADRAHWMGVYLRPDRHRMAQESREAVQQGLTSDRHTWAEALAPLEMPHTVAAFRDEAGRTRLEVHYALPVGRLLDVLEPGASVAEIEVGLVLHDTTWAPVDRHVEVQRVRPGTDRSAAAVGVLGLTVPPDSYQVAVHGEVLHTPLLGGYRWAQRVPDFSGTDLAMSDLLAAHRITPAAGTSRYHRGGLRLQVNPLRRFSVRQPLFLYFELYELTFGADDRTHYEVAYTLRPERRRRGLLGFLFGNDNPVLSLKTTHEGTERSPVEYAELDVRNVSPGDYTLTATITDLQTGRSVTRSIEVELQP